jgi:hypothetical protein
MTPEPHYEDADALPVFKSICSLPRRDFGVDGIASVDSAIETQWRTGTVSSFRWESLA